MIDNDVCSQQLIDKTDQQLSAVCFLILERNEWLNVYSWNGLK